MKNLKIYRQRSINEIPVLIFEKNNIENLKLKFEEVEKIFYKIIDSDILFESTCGLDYFILIDNKRYVMNPDIDVIDKLIPDKEKPRCSFMIYKIIN